MVKTQKHKILIVDDDFLNIEIIEEILGDDFQYKSASSGTQALEFAADFLPDLILLDIMMPDLDGYEVCRQIRQNKLLSLTKIILVSAKQMLRDRLEGYRAGADEYISKPFDHEELLAKINVFLRLKSVEEVERIKSDLLSVFSHETRTPLHTIVGFATLLLENKALSENEREALSHIMKSGHDMLNLIDKTILLSHLKEGLNVIKQNRIQLERLVGMAAERISYESNFHNVDIRIYISPEIVLEADEELMVTAFGYLFDNAIEYADNDSEISVNAEIEDENLILLITATGKAISPKIINTLFSEFMVDDVSHHGRGHGLGLSILKNIIELHDGNVTVVGDPEKKTTSFRVFLPCSMVVTAVNTNPPFE
jgi:two-component system, sensor histidine kinase and response regulator